MKLLIITQVVDREHSNLGSFHRWIEQFARECERIHVICLQEGVHDLPQNVTVHSLGKNVGKGKLSYLFSFLGLIWKLRKEYDRVFVHMNQMYVILGGPIWKLLGKKIGLWYTHGSVSASLKFAAVLADEIYTASPDSFNIKTKKLTVTGHGIDTERFTIESQEKDLDLVTVGRITPSKNIDALIDVMSMIPSHVSLSIVGTALHPSDKAHEEQLKNKVAKLQLTERIKFIGKVEQSELPRLLNRAKIFVTTAINGSLDKAMLEAMACGVPIVSMASGSQSLPLGSAQVTDSDTFVQEVVRILESKKFALSEYNEFIKANHSLQSLIPKFLM